METLDHQINELLAPWIPIIKTVLALAIGILIGWEREYRDNFAGICVMPLVTLGATLFTTYGGVSNRQFINPQVAAGVVTGLGFLCAGVITRQHGALTGVTTASTIWVVAALGMGIGLGLYVQTVLLTCVVLLVLWLSPQVPHTTNHKLTYELTAAYDPSFYVEIQQRFLAHKLDIVRQSVSRIDDQMTCIWFVTGRLAQHRDMAQSLIGDSKVIKFGTRTD